MNSLEKRLSKLISFETVEGNNKEIRACIEYVKDELKSFGMKTSLYKKSDTYSLLGYFKRKKNYKLILSGHLDVVPAGKQEFIPKIKNGKLYGRGAADMKGCVAAMLDVLSYLHTNNLFPDIAIILTTDEEVGGFDGTNYVVNGLGLTSECVFVPDTDPNYKLLIEAKGVLQVKVEAIGKSYHASTPWLGDNAIEKLIKVYDILKKNLQKEVNSSSWNTTVNLGKISGGRATNSVPDFAEMYLDIRHPASFSKEALLKIFDKAASSLEGISYKVVLNADPVFVNTSSKYVKLIKKLVYKHKGFLPEEIRERGNSDARYFSVKGMSVILINPKTSDSHIDSEWVDLADLEIYKNILKDFVLEVAK